MSIDRRSLVGGLSSAALISSVPTSASAREFTNPEDRLAAIARMRSGARGAALWWYQGTFFAKPEGEITRPLMRIDGASRVSFEPAGSGVYRSSMDEAGFFSDLETGQLLDQWRNPLNGKLVEPEHYRSGAVSLITADSVAPDIEQLPPGIVFQGQMTPFVSHGDSAWVSEELFVSAPSQDPREPALKVQTSLATFHSRLSELDDPGLDFVPCELNYSTLATWRGWLEMGDRPGVISWRLVGSKLRDADELPAHLAGLLRERQPDLLELMTAST
jgi:hypothetical protein